MLTNEKGVWHVSQFFGILIGQLKRGRLRIGDNVVHVWGPTCARVTEPHDLYRK